MDSEKAPKKDEDAPKEEASKDEPPMGKKIKGPGPARMLKGKKKKGTSSRGPSSSPRRIDIISPMRKMSPGGTSPRPVHKEMSPMSVNEFNQKFIEQLKTPSIDLRKTGSNIVTDPSLELGLLLDCTSSMGSWISRAKKTIHDIIDKSIKECEEDGSLKCRVSFVGYRDIKD